MSGENDTTSSQQAWQPRDFVPERALDPALVICWSRVQPERSGEAVRLPRDSAFRLLGRGPGGPEDAWPRLRFAAVRPAGAESAETAQRRPLEGARLSRQQLRVRATADSIEVERIGRCAMRVNGSQTEWARLAPGDVIALENELLLLCTERSRERPALGGSRAPDVFGAADPYGMVGESEAAWRLRERIAFLAERDEHVLILGPSGSGKELVARALHAASPRAQKPMIARNAATLPPGLIDAELFGNVKNYPNPGMAERPGLVGEASDSTLFFDEVGELSAELQAHLLRLLDRGGEYQRLGEAKMRNANLRVLAASNRAEAELKHDLAARFPLRIQVPGLDERREDIALLLRHQVIELARDDARIRTRFFDASANPRFDTGLIEALLLHRFTDHVRELTALAWAALLESPAETIELTDGVRARLSARAPVALTQRPTREQVVAALELHGGRRDRAWRELGLKNRDALYRLMKEYGLIESGSGERG